MDCKQKIQSELEATEMWCLRRMMKIPWTAKKTNADFLIDASIKRSIISNIRGRQSRFLGLVMRRTQLEHLITTGKIKGRRDRGRQREKLLDGLDCGTVEAHQPSLLTTQETESRGET